MPHSLRAKLSGLRYKGILEDKDYKRLCKALDNENVLERIRAEIDMARFVDKDTRICKNALSSGLEVAMQIIDKYKAREEISERNMKMWEEIFKAESEDKE